MVESALLEREATHAGHDDVCGQTITLGAQCLEDDESLSGMSGDQ